MVENQKCHNYRTDPFIVVVPLFKLVPGVITPGLPIMFFTVTCGSCAVDMSGR